jgi:hypothetical protein
MRTAETKSTDRFHGEGGFVLYCNKGSSLRLALQLQLIEGSESMGDHDSGSDDWWCVG